MLKRLLAMFLVGLLISTGSARPALALSGEKKDSSSLAQVKERVAKLGVGEKVGVKVKLKDKSEIKGYVYQAGEESFIVADAKTGARTTIAYRDVAQVGRKGLSTGAKIGIGVGIGAVAMIVIVGISLRGVGIGALGR